jgi:hypothetical protein
VSKSVIAPIAISCLTKSSVVVKSSIPKKLMSSVNKRKYLFIFHIEFIIFLLSCPTFNADNSDQIKLYLENGPENTLVFTSQVEEMHVTYKKEKSSDDWEVYFTY